jgi:hypothetical protein
MAGRGVTRRKAGIVWWVHFMDPWAGKKTGRGAMLMEGAWVLAAPPQRSVARHLRLSSI